MMADSVMDRGTRVVFTVFKPPPPSADTELAAVVKEPPSILVCITVGLDSEIDAAARGTEGVGGGVVGRLTDGGD